MITVTVAAEHAGARLDRVVHESLRGVSRAEAQRLIEDGHVTVDGALRSRSSRVQRGMMVVIDVPEKAVVEEEAVVEAEPVAEKAELVKAAVPAKAKASRPKPAKPKARRKGR